ncbi:MULTISPECIES: ABC transporter ATP-binding protein [unclassified Serratia (in: enterobacteria)]|uniref:ABC transporter ATP-binding protein n=1 Tax=unclassified Serratia (in: enterobacteria) TaxID=2647522 RepID=UPI000506661A|nr:MULTISPECIES: ABC transporter ATP-binding protein [unclassified Serratia (in: enterobacteria)]KFK92082.1 ABC transporter [Serratia sp. Ag2]KFK96176.1 ABC transporter [Serratia sp. Ag1]
MWAVEIKEICKSYYLGQSKVEALRDINIKIASQRFTVLSGQSGSGKTTLLNVIGGIDCPDSGRLVIAGQEMSQLSDDQRSAFRARYLGFIFQNFNLIPVLNVWENVEIPLILQGTTVAQRKSVITNMLETVGLADKARSLPGQLSGGQRQRVAIARALIHRPSLVLADEPTANLDSKTGNSILQLLRRLQQEHSVTVVFSSHDPQVIAEADVLYKVHDGNVTQIAMQ